MYPTGRTRTITVTGAFSGRFAFEGGGLSPVGWVNACRLRADLWAAGVAISPGFPYIEVGVPEGHFGNGTGTLEDQISYRAGWGSFGSDHVNGILPHDWALTATSGSTSVAGTFSASVEAVEMFRLLDPTDFIDSSLFEADGLGVLYPKWGGSAFFRGMPANGIEFYEVILEGSIGTLSGSIGGVSISVNHEFATTLELQHGHTLFAGYQGQAFGTTGPSESASVVISVNGRAMGYEWEAEEGGNIATTDNGAAVTMAAVPDTPASVDNLVTCSHSFMEPMEYVWNLKAFRYAVEHDEELTFVCTDLQDAVTTTGVATNVAITGSGTREVEQRREWITAVLNTELLTEDEEVNTVWPCWAYVDGSSLTAAGENADNWRTWIHGKPYAAGESNHEQVFTMTGTSTSGWSAGANTSLATGVQFTVSGGGAGSATKTFSPGVSCESYRWIRLQVRSVGSANVPFSVEIDGRTWEFETGADGAWVDRWLDTCCATSDSWVTDTQSTRWPVTFGSEPEYPISTTPAWGVNELTTLEVKDIPASSVIQIRAIDQVRRQFNRATFVANLSNEQALWTSGGDDTTGWTNIFVSCDGRCVDLPDQYHITPISGPDYYVHYTIAQEFSLFENMNGYDIIYGEDEGFEYQDAFHTDALNAFFIGGAGHIAAHSGSGVTWSAVDAQSLVSGTIRAQALWDVVLAYPGAGDCFSGTSYETATPLACRWFGHGRVEGIVFDTSGQPVEGATVTSSPNRGSGTTDSQGTYRTGAPYPFEGESVDWIPAGGSSNDVAGAHLDGGEMRICWREDINVEGAGISYDVHPDSRHVVAYIRDSDVMLGFSDNAGLDTITFEDTGIDAEIVVVAWKKSGEPILCLYLVDSGSILRYTTASEGVSFDGPETIGSGTRVIGFTGSDNQEQVYYVDGGALKGVIRDAQGNELHSEFTVVASGVDDAQIGGHSWFHSDGRWRTLLWYLSSGTRIKLESINGVDFS
ncbi:MAG: carboxypeptidase regulatory-like domain-containing protein [Chthonomonas sp.]|nr:carboxypeptidase regulatory-like domain-containing protein [Chthonomonas sp.]